MNRVNLSKSNGGGSVLESGIRCPCENGFLLSSSCISMAKKSSLSTPPGFRTARSRTEVSVCATVSAMPPRTYCSRISEQHLKGTPLEAQCMCSTVMGLYRDVRRSLSLLSELASKRQLQLSIIEGEECRTWSTGIVGVELPGENRNDRHLDQEYQEVKERLTEG